MTSSRKIQPWVSVAIFENVSDGQMLEMDLKDKGFETRTYDDKLLQCFLFLCPPHATIRVQVRGNDFKNVTYFLDHEPATSFLLPTLLLHLGIIFRVIAHEAYCESCHWLWGLPKKRVSAPAEPLAAKAIS